MAVTLNASTSTGYIQTADTSGDLALQSNGTTQFNVTSTGAYGQLKFSTAVTASGSSVDFTSIPSWVKRITVMLVGVSTAAAGTVRIRIGPSSGLVTTGYAGGGMSNTTAPANGATNLGASPEGIGGFGTADGTTLVYGSFVVTNVTGNTWVASGMVYRLNDSIATYTNGSIALSGVLDRISVVATTSTFDAGTINILYEG
jgi:hypothetical protein